MPPSGAIGALLPLSAVAAVTACEIYTDDHGWTILVPVVLPPLFAGYTVWARLPALHRVLRPLPTGALVGLAVAALSIVPLVQSHQAARPNPAREAALRAGGGTRGEGATGAGRVARPGRRQVRCAESRLAVARLAPFRRGIGRSRPPSLGRPTPRQGPAG